MASANTTNQLPLLKRLYGNKVAEPLYKQSSFLASIKKDTSFGGEGRYVNVRIGPTAGGSATFADALAAQDATQEKRFFVTHRKNYEVFSIQGDLIARCRGNGNAVVEAVKNQTDGARYAFARSMSRMAWGNGGGARAQLASTTVLASTNLDLRSPADIVGFEPGMQLEFASDDGSAASPAGRRGAPDRLTVVTVNREIQRVITNANLSTVNSITVNDFVFRRGDYAAAMSGERGWNPITAPGGGDNFMGMDRSVGDVSRQSGYRINGAGKPKEETLVDAMVIAHENGMSVNRCFVNSRDFGDITKEMGSKVVLSDVKTREADIGFKGFVVHGAVGQVEVVAEADVPRGYFWLVDPDLITLRTAGDCPMILNEDKVGAIRFMMTDDAYQSQLGAYGNLFNENPGNVVVGTW